MLECEGIDDWDPNKDYSYLLCPKCGMCKCHACTCGKGSPRSAKFHSGLNDEQHGNDEHSDGDNKFDVL